MCTLCWTRGILLWADIHGKWHRFAKSWKGEVNLQIYGCGDIGLEEKQRNVGEMRSWVPPGLDAKIHCFGGQCGRLFLSACEDAGLNGWLLSCDLNQRTAETVPCFMGCWETIQECVEHGCVHLQGEVGGKLSLLPRHCNLDVAFDTQRHCKKQIFNGVV